MQVFIEKGFSQSHSIGILSIEIGKFTLGLGIVNRPITTLLFNQFDVVFDVSFRLFYAISINTGLIQILENIIGILVGQVIINNVFNRFFQKKNERIFSFFPG